MIINYYKQYNIDRNLSTGDIRGELENKCSDIIRRLNNAGGNADREYELRKSLERMEVALEVFINDESRQVYDKSLRQGAKGGMLTNEEIQESQVEEDYNLDTMDQEKLESLLEKIVSRQAEKVKETAKETDNKSTYNGGSNSSQNLNKDKADSIARLALMEIETEMDGYIWRSTNQRITDYIDDALQLDSSNYLAWHARFINLLAFQGNQFRTPWDFASLGEMELNKLTQGEVKSIHNEIELAELGGLSTHDISKSIIEWEKTCATTSKEKKKRIKNKFDEQTINSRQQNILGAINKVKESKKNNTLANLLEKVYQGHKERPYSLQDKIRRMLPSESRYKELMAFYNRTLELAPKEEKDSLEANMEEVTNEIYYHLLVDGYKQKKEVLDSYSEKRYKEADNLEEDVLSAFKQIRTRTRHIINPAIDQACYILMAVMVIFMLSWFVPTKMGMVAKYIIMLSGYLITSIAIIKLRGPYRYNKIVFYITSIPIFLAVINLFIKNTRLIEISSEANAVLIILAIVIAMTLIQAIRKKSAKFIVTDLIFNGKIVLVKCMIPAFLIGLIFSFFLDIWTGLFMVSCMAVPSMIQLMYMEGTSIYKRKDIPGINLNLGIRNYVKLEETAKGMFPGGKIFKI